MTPAEALVALLAAPIHPSLIGLEAIGYKYKLPRHPNGRCCAECSRTNSDPELIKRDLGTAYVTWRRQAHGVDISCVVSVRRLRMVKRA